MSKHKHFFSHIISLSDLEDQMKKSDLSNDEQEELLLVVHKTIHIEVITMALGELPETERPRFLELHEDQPYDTGLLVYLSRSIDNFEDRVQSIARGVVEDVKQFLHEYHDASKDWLVAEDLKITRFGKK